MKNKFQHFISLNEGEISNIWNDCIFVIDTNIILNLYRYTEQTKDEFIKILMSYKGRVWITNHSAQEYFKNRITVIQEQETEYDKLLRSLESDIISPLSNKRRPPHISETTLTSLHKVIDEMKHEINQTIEKINDKIKNDTILIKILELFEDRVTDEYDKNQLNKIYQEGNERYEKKIPPGFKDSNKPDNDKFGDLIIWKQIIELSKKENKNIIFVTDDQKEDWILISRGKKISPQPLLMKEFSLETKYRLYIYNAENFMTYISEDLKQKVDKSIIEEVKDIGGIISRMHKIYLENSTDQFLIVDISEFSNISNDVIVYIYSKFNDLNHLTDTIFFDLRNKGIKISAFSYGYEWVGLNERTNEVIKNARMITRTEKGKVLADTRRLEEVGILANDKLRILKISVEILPKPE